MLVANPELEKNLKSSNITTDEAFLSSNFSFASKLLSSQSKGELVYSKVV